MPKFHLSLDQNSIYKLSVMQKLAIILHERKHINAYYYPSRSNDIRTLQKASRWKKITKQVNAIILYLPSEPCSKLKRKWLCLKLFTAASHSQLMEHEGHRRRLAGALIVNVPTTDFVSSDGIVPCIEELKEANLERLWVTR